MSSQSIKLPVWFWVIATAALLWNLIGVAAYVGDVTLSEDALSKLPEAQQSLRSDTPAWLTGIYAIAVFSGAVGSIVLLLRKSLATPIFVISLAAIVVQMGCVLFGTNAIGALGASAAIFPVIVMVIGASLVWFSAQAKNKGWLN